MTPKEKLIDAVHRLAGNAENLEEVVDPDFAAEMGAAHGLRRDQVPEVIRGHLETQKRIVKEIEEIVK
jgi:hypothetical protein